MSKPIYETVKGSYFGRRVRYELSKGEWQLYRAAIQRGYFISSDRARGLGRDAYRAWCEDNKRPFVALIRGRRTCQIIASLHPVQWWLTEEIQQHVRCLFAFSGWIKGYCDDGIIDYRGVPRARACKLTEQLLRLLWAAREPWERFYESLPTAEAERA